jgi:hypothetical protein
MKSRNDAFCSRGIVVWVFDCDDHTIVTEHVMTLTQDTIRLCFDGGRHPPGIEHALADPRVACVVLDPDLDDDILFAVTPTTSGGGMLHVTRVSRAALLSAFQTAATGDSAFQTAATGDSAFQTDATGDSAFQTDATGDSGSTDATGGWVPDVVLDYRRHLQALDDPPIRNEVDRILNLVESIPFSRFIHDDHGGYEAVGEILGRASGGHRAAFDAFCMWLCRGCDRYFRRVMPFGKHKGQLLAKIPQSYVTWLTSSPDVSPKHKELFHELGLLRDARDVYRMRSVFNRRGGGRSSVLYLESLRNGHT